MPVVPNRARRIGPLTATICVLLAVPSLLPGQAPEGGADDDAQAEAVVEPGDRVEISMFTGAGEELNEVSGTRTVDRNGLLFLPYVGQVRVEGLAAAEIRSLLSQRYGDFYSNPVVDVETRIRVNVTGAVRQPGNYFLAPTSTIVDALATAGGVNSEVEGSGAGAAADPSRIRLVRQGQAARVLDLRPQTADADVLNTRIRSGDWLHVPPRAQSRWRSNLQLMSSFLSVVGSLAALGILIAR